MITVKTQGGLGNQLFQYTFGRAVSSRLNTELNLETSFYDTSPNRIFLLDKFNIKAKTKKASLLKRWYSKNKFREKNQGFDSSVFGQPDGSTFEGYWQSEKYFEGMEKELRKELTLKHGLSTQAEEVMKRAQTDNSVSLHVRRGDYAAVEKIKNVHGLLTAAYYQKALSEILQKISSPTLFVFSDDIPWVKENLSFPYPVEYVSELSLPEYEELFIMSACRHHIIANSTFSWWGAWLDARADKTVIAPKNWFNDVAKNSSDIVPTQWIKI